MGEFEASIPDLTGEVYSYVRSRIADRPTAEDITQEVLLAAARRAGSGLAVETPWLIAVARNKVVDHWRCEARRHRRLPMALNGDVGGDGEGAAEIERILAALPTDQRAALVLRHLDGLGVPDVARLLGRSVRATEQILTRGRRRFRDLYREVNDD